MKTKRRAGIRLIILITLVLMIGFSLAGSTPQVRMERFSYQHKLSKKERKWIRKQMKRMRLEEKIGQMLMVRVPTGFVNIGSDEFKRLRHRIMENHVGGILVAEGAVYSSTMLINRLQELARFPLLVASELEAGAGMRIRGATTFPWNLAVGATGDPTWAERQGAITAQEARAMGINVLFAPLADLSRPHRNQFNVRAYGDDPKQVARFVTAFIRGAQAYGVMATVKYFPGYGNASLLVTGGFPTVVASAEQLQATEAVPFGAAILARVGAIMVGHIAVPALDATPLGQGQKSAGRADNVQGSIPATISASILAGSLRRKSGFAGLIITDSLDSERVVSHLGSAAATARAIKAGADILLSPGNVDQAMRAVWEAVRRGEIKEERINESVRRILTSKARLGLAVNRFTDIDIIDEFVSSRRFQQVAQSIARKSVTLVRNEEDRIPILPSSVQSILHVVVTDVETSQRERQVVGRALNSELKRRIARTERVVIDPSTAPGQVPLILRRAGDAALVILSLFSHPPAEGVDLALPRAGARVLKELQERHQPLIVISFGSPYLLVEYPAISSYICAYGDARDSESSQRAVAEALFGEIPCQGKLPVALPGLYPRGHGIFIGASRRQVRPKPR